MAKRRGRRGRPSAVPSDSDSVGRTGASLPQQEIEPIRPEYPLPESASSARPQPPQGGSRGGNQAARPNRPPRRRRRRGRGGAPRPGTQAAAPAVASPPEATLTEPLPEAAEPVSVP